MVDDGMSASQLRQRYGPGGSADDSSLSASQLRARHNLSNRNFDDQKSNSMIYVVAIILLVAAGVAFKLLVLDAKQ